MSLSALLDISAPPDFLRGLLSLMQEFDSVADDKFELDRKNVCPFSLLLSGYLKDRRVDDNEGTEECF